MAVLGLFYKSNLHPELLRNKFEQEFQGIPTGSDRFQLLTKINSHKPTHFSNAEISMYLIGNVNLRKNFNPNLAGLISSTGIKQKELDSTLRRINGTFCCVLVEHANQRFHLISDHLGFYPIYIYQDENIFIFSSELKYFQQFNPINLTIDQNAVRSYLQNGHIMFDRSWFQHVSRMRPASIYSFENNSIIENNYWSWDRINENKYSLKESKIHYAKYFHQGISELDLESTDKIGISLSGGMDSRWIATLVSQYFNASAYCFSNSINYEYKIARKVCDKLQIPLRNYHIQKDNWLRDRLEAFWKTDGMLHLGHLHEGNLFKKLDENYKSIFHGFFGGGVYANHRLANQRITKHIAKNYFKTDEDNLRVDDAFYNIRHIDPYIIDQKIRNQSAFSIYLLSTNCKLVLPFYNMDWITFNYSLDDTWQLNNKYYLDVLNDELPSALLSIPWQRTGIAPKQEYLNQLALQYRIPQIKEYISQVFKSSRHFINYNLYDKEINFWLKEFKSDVLNLGQDYKLNSRESKLRMLSLVIILRMLDKNSADVI